MGRPQATLLITFVMLLLVSLLFVGFVPKKYRFPFNPDSLLGSLYLLAPSALVKKLGDIEHPEKKSLQEINDIVEKMDLDVSIGMVTVMETGESRWAVVVNDEDREQEVYRDSE